MKKYFIATMLILISWQQAYGVSGQDFCKKINEKFNQYGWSKIICNPATWNIDDQYVSSSGNPLLYQKFGNGNVTTALIFCSVHGDEFPATYLCFHLARDILFDHRKEYKNVQIVIAPLVNPDGMLAVPATRTNSNGVDLNRNFPTKDFDKHAISSWTKEGQAQIPWINRWQRN
jgi:protein MpaA